MRRIILGTLLASLLTVNMPTAAQADAPGYRKYGYDESSEQPVQMSPKPGWKAAPKSRASTRGSRPWWSEILLWLPNRVMDLVDVFRIDVGVGPTVGGVFRATRNFQAGYREVAPFSLRVGDFGRQAPFLLEFDSEKGVGDKFKASESRKICQAEFGLGLDLGLGAYGGICGEELLDFITGLVGVDLEADDM